MRKDHHRAERRGQRDIAPSAVFVSVDRIVRFAEARGWPTEQAFHIAMLLTIDGVTVSEAQQLLADNGIVH